MSQIILDDQLADLAIRIPLARWTTVQRLREIRPGEVIKDERVPLILRELRQPTFVTIDMGFWNAGLRDPRYCMRCFPLRIEDQQVLPGLLRQVLRLPEFATRAARMGKVARISQAQVDYWQIGDVHMRRLLLQSQSTGRILREEAPIYVPQAQEPAADVMEETH